MSGDPAFDAGYRVGVILGLVLCCGAILAIVALVVWLVVRSQRRGRGPATEAGQPGMVPPSPSAGGPAAGELDAGAAAFGDLGVPAYPGARIVGSQAGASGGRERQLVFTADPIEQVAAFYRARLGPETGPGLDWQLPGPTPEGARWLQIMPPLAPSPSAPIPPGALSMIVLTR